MGIWGSVSAGDIMELAVSNELIDVREIRVSVRMDASNARLIVEQLSEKPDLADAPGIAYSYLKIDLYNVQNEGISDAVIKFRVSKAWLAENNILEDNVILRRYNGGAWEGLATTVAGGDADYVYFEAVSPGFSYFAVIGEPSEEEDVVEELPGELPEEEPVEEEAAEPEAPAPVAAPAPPQPVKRVSTAQKILKWFLIAMLFIIPMGLYFQEKITRKFKKEY
jgi:PGF-pre-PGF domain-containing protein